MHLLLLPFCSGLSVHGAAAVAAFLRVCRAGVARGPATVLPELGLPKLGSRVCYATAGVPQKLWLGKHSWRQAQGSLAQSKSVALAPACCPRRRSASASLPPPPAGAHEFTVGEVRNACRRTGEAAGTSGCMGPDQQRCLQVPDLAACQGSRCLDTACSPT